MSAESFEVAVVGAGLAGLSTAAELAGRGHSVCVLEQFEYDHAAGSSHGDARVFRLSYDQSDYVAMAMRALEGWRRLERDHSAWLLTVTGGLDLGPPETWAGHLAALNAAGVACTVVEGAALLRVAPALTGTRGPALWQEDGGTLHADWCLRCLRAQVEREGGEVRDHWPVTSFREGSDSVSVSGPAGTVTAGQLVLAGGPWNRELAGMAGLSLPLTLTAQTVAHLRVDALPPVFIDHGLSPALYGLRTPSGLLKAALHGGGQALDHPGPAREPDPSVAESIIAALQEHLGATPELRHLESCVYTSTPDEDFAIALAGLVTVVSACSGHGFKFGPALGQLVADVVEGESVPPRFDAGRFPSGR
ncbi:MAG: FAD-dependent oxidoreductase [Candidatus Dormibacteria bacterium]